MIHDFITRRAAIRRGARGMIGGALMGSSSVSAAEDRGRPWIKIRGIYGGYPDQMFANGKSPVDYGVNAIWVGSGGLDARRNERYRELGIKVFAEFNSMHAADFLKEHPDAAPIGPDGQRSPAPNGWQGVSPFHASYRQARMAEFRRVLQTFDIDGIWLDYHHAQASWEQAEPNLPDTDFSPAALEQFTAKTGIELPQNTAEAAKRLLGQHLEAWAQFRCDTFTDWVREYREIVNEVRPQALLGTFHCPWSPDDLGGAIRHKLAIDLKAQAKYIDVFSSMPYHARFGHAEDVEWISRQTEALGKLLDSPGKAGATPAIWPIVQLADWGESVAVAQIPAIIERATRPPCTGVMVFHWSGVSREPEKIEALGKAYRALE